MSSFLYGLIEIVKKTILASARDNDENAGPRGPLRRLLSNPIVLSIVILILAGTLRIVHVREAVESPLMRDTIPMFDSQYYDKVAREVAEGDLIGDEVFYLAPLYPYAMGVPYRLFRKPAVDGGFTYDIDIVRYIQCIMGAFSCVLIFWIGRLGFGPRIGLLAGLMASVYGVFIYYDGIIMPSSLILTLHLLALLVMLLAGRHGSAMLWVAGGLLLGLCCVAHGSAVFVLCGVLPWIWIGCRETSNRTKLKRTCIVVAAFLPVVATVTVRNYVAGNDFVVLTSNVGRNLYIGHNPTATGSYVRYVFDHWGNDLHHYLKDMKRTPDDMPPSESSRLLTWKAIEFVKENPGQELKLLLKKIRLLFNATETSINDNYYFAGRYSSVLGWGVLSFWIIAPIALTGLLYSMRQWRKHLLLMAFITSQVAAFAIFFVLGRYRLVLTACLMPLAASQIILWWSWLRNKKYLQAALSMIPLVLFSALVHYPIEGFDKTRGFAQQYDQVGDTYFRWGEYDRARDAYEKVAEFDFEPFGDQNLKHSKSLLKLANAQEQLQDLHAAAAACGKAMTVLEGAAEEGTDEKEIALQRKRVEDKLKDLRRKMAASAENE